MATQQDVQELLRLLVSARKLPMLQAMSHVKALQTIGLKSIRQVAEATLADVENAVPDAKAARSLHNACKAALLRYTMPEQPPSSRLSMAQAVVSANSRSKAHSLGIENAPPAEREGWGEGQPKVRIMGREIYVLKRGGYTWNGEESITDSAVKAEGGDDAPSPSNPIKSEPQASPPIKLESQSQSQSQTQQLIAPPPATPQPRQLLTWSTSQSISLKESTFVARATHMADPAERKKLVSSLMTKYPHLKTATHNAWAYRARPPGSSRIVEEKFDDGETGCGALILQMLRDADVADTLVVLTRWFGGKFLGPDRFRLMRNCVRGALSERMRLTGADAGLGAEAVWGLDVEAMRSKSTTAGGTGSSAATRHHRETTVVGMQIHRPESARNYLLRSFATASPPTPAGPSKEEEEEKNATEGGGSGDKKPAVAKKKKTQKEINLEKEENLGLLLGALRLLYDSWADHLTAVDLDQRAWGWYTAVRPSVDSGPSGWGAKGTLELRKILDLRRKA
ncbi:hypothetical protein MAPG_07332 [Magnaporthiopsis poae ATCC 64411]|uniref:Impact N-terminal domain-containing protein n=1 Tax=Magnaporthiopsis poae (strain ATCC 64411 / 73-15) TaxID=644358 RepID=A0A0C4E4D9_MAGP6|nr:hypothetical protein MAPG_07332 [Magnaporthiopsis poae ATCC 64411]